MSKEEEFKVKPYIVIALCTFVVVFCAYFINFKDLGVSHKQEDWGTFGDFIGGTLNPIFAFLSFIALLWTIKLQSKELKNSTKEVKLTRKEFTKSNEIHEEQKEAIILQNFENTFFRLVDLHNKITESLEITIYIDGLPYFTKNNIKDAHKNIYTFIEEKFIETPAYIELFPTSINNTLKENQHILGNYFRNIYQILKYIDEENIKNKKRYSNILRAQFSEDELIFLYYNCLDWKDKFLPLLIEYEFLEHMPCKSYFMYNDNFLILKEATENVNKEYPIFKIFGKNKEWKIQIEKDFEKT